jgi:hypothetical protein
VEHWSKAARLTEHVTLQPYLQDLKSRYRDSRLAWFEVFLGAYTDCQDVAILPSRATTAASPLLSQNSVPVNVCMPVVDTAEAKIAGATRPRPYFKGVGADSTKKRKCKKLQKFVDGEFDRTRAYSLGSQLVKDAGIFGTAGLEPYIRNGQICLDRVLASEMLVDDNLAFDANPREMTRVREMSKRLLLSWDLTKSQKEAVEALIPVGTSHNKWSDLVEVFDTVCLPSSGERDEDGKLKHPGRRVITVHGATIKSEPWAYEYFPWVIFRWSEMPTGFFGQGLIQQVLGIQLEITRWFKNISKSLHLLANPRVILANGGQVDQHHITNAWGTILRYQPPFKPEVWTSQIMPPEVYQWFENMYQKAFERVGLSAQSAFARKEAGVDSGKHARELSDIQADRLAPISVRYQNVFLDLSRRYIDLAEKLFEADKEFSTIVSEGRGATRLRYADVRLDPQDYDIQMFATAFLARTPGAAFDDVKDLMAAELIDADEARALMDFPDLQRVFDLRNSARDHYEQCIEAMLDRGLLILPESYDGLENLKLGKAIVQDAYNRARVEAVEQSKLALFRQWLDACVGLIDAAEAELAAKQQPPPAEQQAPPDMAPPPMGMA